MLLVVSGVYLAFMQFKLDEKRALARIELEQMLTQKKLAGTLDGNQSPSNEKNTTTLEINSSGIKISSSVIGLVVLAMSFAFFYMYLQHVYNISVIPN